MSTILCSGGFLAAVAYGAASLRPDLIGVITTSTLAGAAFALVHSSLAASASDVVPGQRAVVMSLFVASVFAGSSLVTATLAPLAASHQHDRVFGPRQWWH